ncbi:S8 family serine peptidase [Sinorhizobium medicae]|nr:S8 family serine peptidase [Sinorhizobium medicae]
MGDKLNVIVVTRQPDTETSQAGLFGTALAGKLRDLTGVNFADISDFKPQTLALGSIPLARRIFATTTDRSQAPSVRHAVAGAVEVEAAWIEEIATIPFYWASTTLRDSCFARPVRDTVEPPAKTPDFSSRQPYLLDAPTGLGVLSSHAVAGAMGEDIRIIDVEGGWRFQHEDFPRHSLGILFGDNAAEELYVEHGTSMVSILSSRKNDQGVTGIAPEAAIGGCACGDAAETHTSAAIRAATGNLRPGDILLLELQRTNSRNQLLPVEWWPADFWAILEATQRGIIVVSAAGNGGISLDDPSFDQPEQGIHPSWKNPLSRLVDSGSILVGAGTPEPGVHGVTACGPARARMPFSNFGQSVDAQGWGSQVTSAGFGSLQGGTDPNRFYMDESAGTSSAAPFVAGALACVQGALKKAERPLLSPRRARDLLRSTGTPQQSGNFGGEDQRIGSLPNIMEMLAACGL